MFQCLRSVPNFLLHMKRGSLRWAHRLPELPLAHTGSSLQTGEAGFLSNEQLFGSNNYIPFFFQRFF
jgi:hypothetical protein